MSDPWNEALSAAERRRTDLRRAMLALLYVRARQRAAIDIVRRELEDERRAVQTARARRPELALVGQSRLRRHRQRLDDASVELAELEDAIENVAVALCDARRTIDDLRTERLQAVAATAQREAMRPRPELDDAIEEARASLYRLRALAVMGV